MLKYQRRARLTIPLPIPLVKQGFSSDEYLCAPIAPTDLGLIHYRFSREFKNSLVELDTSARYFVDPVTIPLTSPSLLFDSRTVKETL